MQLHQEGIGYYSSNHEEVYKIHMQLNPNILSLLIIPVLLALHTYISKAER